MEGATLEYKAALPAEVSEDTKVQELSVQRFERLCPRIKVNYFQAVVFVGMKTLGLGLFYSSTAYLGRQYSIGEGAIVGHGARRLSPSQKLREAVVTRE